MPPRGAPTRRPWPAPGCRSLAPLTPAGTRGHPPAPPPAPHLFGVGGLVDLAQGLGTPLQGLGIKVLAVSLAVGDGAQAGGHGRSPDQARLLHRGESGHWGGVLRRGGDCWTGAGAVLEASGGRLHAPAEMRRTERSSYMPKMIGIKIIRREKGFPHVTPPDSSHLHGQWPCLMSSADTGRPRGPSPARLELGTPGPLHPLRRERTGSSLSLPHARPEQTRKPPGSSLN